MATKSTIATRSKRPPTPAQRLRTLDPALADQMDELAAILDREYDLAVNENPAPPILDAEVAWSVEGWRLDIAQDPLLEVADNVRKARDEAYMVLGRVEQLIAQRTLEAIRLTPQAALPPPPPTDSFDDGDPTEDFSAMRPKTWERRVSFHPAADEDWGFDPDEKEAPASPRAVRVGRWWPRALRWGQQLRAATTFLLAGIA